MTRDITVAFLDKNNNLVGRKIRKSTSFRAGEAKVISNTFVLNAFEANKIATGHVTIN